MTLRFASVSDRDAIFRMLSSFHAVSPFTGRIDSDKVYAEIDAFIEGDNTERLLLLSVDGLDRPVGLIALAAVPFLFNHDKTVAELVFWVDPEARRGRRAVRLIEAAEYWSKKIGASRIVLSHLSGSESVGKMYTKLGYSQFETGYEKCLS